jgi:RNA polymerase sigma factor (sigma-70 family)
LAALPSIGRASRVEGAAAPEADATRDLYERYANQIFRYCLHQLGSREEAEDAVQSTFLNAFRGIKRGIVPDLESAWLFKIAHNVCLSRRRSAWRRGRIESPTDFEVVEELAAAPARRADELIGLQNVLEQLPETQRRAILLREWQGLSYREIAGELELSQAAVETLIFRARRSLASGLEEPPAPRKRLAQALDLGNVFTGVKSLLLGGSAAAKIAATVAAVSATTVVATQPVLTHHVQKRPAPAVGDPAARPAAKTTPIRSHRPVAPATATPTATQHQTVAPKVGKRSGVPAPARKSVVRRLAASTPTPAPAADEEPVTPVVAAPPPGKGAKTVAGQAKHEPKGAGGNGKSRGSWHEASTPAQPAVPEQSKRGQGKAGERPAPPSQAEPGSEPVTTPRDSADS